MPIPPSVQAFVTNGGQDYTFFSLAKKMLYVLLSLDESSDVEEEVYDVAVLDERPLQCSSHFRQFLYSFILFSSSTAIPVYLDTFALSSPSKSILRAISTDAWWIPS